MPILRRILLAAAVALPAAGCFNPAQPACGFSCAGDGLCPSGYTCGADQLCHRDDGQGVCELDGGAPDAGRDASGQ